MSLEEIRDVRPSPYLFLPSLHPRPSERDTPETFTDL